MKVVYLDVKFHIPLVWHHLVTCNSRYD